ncbi:membrane protein [Streptomyces phage OnionKnight]|nr:membrane protein [Streptomyces phage OnionKnight]
MADQQPNHTPPPPATSGLGLAVGAAVIITGITGIAFWLSYHHLHDVAEAHGLGTDPARAWAWPAVLDLFYLAGELLILRASYLRTVDPWAIALTAIGALGSIGLNVAGVGPAAPVLEYVVAAVPPVAALLAFGALMRQMHLWFARRPAAEQLPAAAPAVTVERAEPPVPPMPEQAPALPPADDEPGEQLALEEQRPERPAIRYSDPRCAIIRPLYDDGFRPTTGEMAAALVAAKVGKPSASILRGNIRAEIENHEPHLKDFPQRPTQLHQAG